MRIAPTIASLLLAVTLAGCGGEQAATSPEPTGDSTTATATTPSPTPTVSATPETPTYKIMEKAGLEKALLDLDQLPPGYSQDPPLDDGENKYFCDYKPPFEEKFRVRRDFTKGAGLSAEVISMTLRQFKSEDEASAAWKAMTKTLKTCTSDEYDGSKLTYSPMSAPKLGDDSTGVRIESDGATVLQNFVLVGPVMISGGAGGLMNVDADTVAKLLKTQVEQYKAAAMS